MWSGKGENDGGATKGLIPTHVQEADQTNKASQVYFLSPAQIF